jgi:CheY-like chemotaxis protein
VVPALLVGYSVRLLQILVNLVSNAVKFTEFGEVVLRVNQESEADGNLILHFTVSDTGIGIPDGKQHLIFDAFTQADGSTTRKYGGTGLGLTISSRLVSLMGGRIWVESTAGVGSKFHFTVRLGASANQAPSVSANEPIDLRSRRVLVVDDNATNRRILRDVLLNWQMDVVVVESGKAALELAKAERAQGRGFELFVLDCHMPDMDGFEVAGRLKEEEGSAEPLILMLTSGVQSGHVERCRELGITSHLVKPIRQQELLDVFRQVPRSQIWKQRAQAYRPA